MKQTLTTYQIAGLLMADTNAKWSQTAAYALAEYFEQLEQDTGAEMEFDAVAIRCDWNEYSNFEEIAESYGVNIEGLGNIDAKAKVIEYVNDHSQIIELENGKGFLVFAF